MRFLGITDGQTSGAAVIEDGRVLAAVNEERIIRVKLARGFPWRSIREVLRLSDTEPGDLEAVGVAQVDMQFREEVSGWPGWFEARENTTSVHNLFFRIASRFGSLVPRIPGLKKAYYGLRTPIYSKRRRRIREILPEHFGIEAPVHFIHHHFAHATSAYYTSGMSDALAVTLDGGGDGHCSHIYSVREGDFEKLVEVDSYDSLGNYYAYITAICGFKAKRHEGKITGLAARGEPIYADLLRGMIDTRGGRLVNRGKVLFKEAMDTIRSQLPDDWKREDLAASIQIVAEDVTRRYVGHWVEETGHRHLAVAGGLFANVRINQELQDLPGVESVFVHPGMSDEGLGLGAGLAVARKVQGERLRSVSFPSVYLGPEFGDSEIRDALREHDLEVEHYPGEIEAEVARWLADGRVVARFAGRMEYGPRALGNRSILYQPNDPSVNDWLNELLRRTEFMPFAPSVLWERAGDLFDIPAGAYDTARFMTMTFDCTPYMKQRCAGVVHVDGTARPQLVRRDENPSYWKIIKGYEDLTGVPVVINTSFNVHEEPIVRSPADAVRAFLDSRLDLLAIGDFLVRGPTGSDEVRQKWEGKESVWGRRVASPSKA